MKVIYLMIEKNTLFPFCLERLFGGFVVARYLEYIRMFIYTRRSLRFQSIVITVSGSPQSFLWIPPSWPSRSQFGPTNLVPFQVTLKKVIAGLDEKRLELLDIVVHLEKVTVWQQNVGILYIGYIGNSHVPKNPPLYPLRNLRRNRSE